MRTAIGRLSLAVCSVAMVASLMVVAGPTRLLAAQNMVDVRLPSTYWLAGADGTVYGLGSAGSFGSVGVRPLNDPVVGMAATLSAKGYWLVAADGGVFSFGDARFFGSTGNVQLNQPVVAMPASATGRGYWLVARDGGVFSFGDAGFFGSTGNVRLNQPVVGMAATPTGHGYWLVARDGGVFSFGDAAFFGSTGNVRLNQSVVGMAPTPTGRGYWLVAADGGLFTFGDAGFYGSTGSVRLARPVVGMAASLTGRGYWLVAADGGVFTFGDALFRGSLAGTPLAAPIVAMARTESLDPYLPGSTGYDISWPQCGSSYPAAPFRLAVVGVGGKVTFTHNPCLASEVAWFRSATVTLYVKLSSPAMGAPDNGNSGPAGTCAPTDSLCQSYNYGWNLISDAYRYAQGQGVSSGLWWLDVERPTGSASPLWGSDLVANSRVVAAGIAALDSFGVQPGIYSNSYQWPRIAGRYAPDVPMWQARPNPDNSPSESAPYCHTLPFTSGPVWLVQYGSSTFDKDLAC